MADAPWSSDPVVGDYEHGGFNQAMPANGAQTAPVSAAAAPWANDPAAQPVQPSGQPSVPPLVDRSVSVAEFPDDTQPRQVAEKLAPQDEAQLLHILQTGTADDARRFAASKGFAGPDNFDEIIKARDAGAGVSRNFAYHLPQMPNDAKEMQGPGAFGRGIGKNVPFIDELGAVADSLGGTSGRENVFNSDHSFGELYNRNVDINRGMLDADEANHPVASLTGQILSGLAIPSGLEGVGLNAGKSVLVAGGTMREARAAAAAAVRNRVATIGGVYDGLQGAGNADGGIGNRIAGGVAGAAEGAAGGYGLTAAGQAVVEHAPQIWAGIRAPLTADAAGQVEPSPEVVGAPDYVQIARDLNIQRTPATNSGTGFATVAQSGLGALPGGSPVAAGTDREVSDLATAAKNVATGVGNVSDRQGAGEAVAQGAQQYKAASRLQANSLYGQRDALIGGPNTPVPTDQAAAAIQDMAAKFPTSPAIQQLREHPAIRAIADALPGQNDQPLTLGEVTEALSHVRGVQRNLAATSVTTGPVLARVNQLEQALENDVKTAASKADIAAGRVPGADGSALKAQNDADAFYADRAAALNGALKRPLQSAADDTKVSGEAVYNQIYGDMNQKSGNLSRLRDTWFRLPEQAKSTFAATAIDDLGRAAPGAQNDAGNAWSFQSFLTNINKLSPQARNIVFGAKADAQLNQVAAYANRLRQLDRARNFSNTAQKYFAGAFMATVGSAVMHGNLGTAAEAAAALPATWGGAKLLLATPKMRDWTVQAMKAISSAAQGQNNETAFRVLTNRLGSIAASEPSIADQALGLQRHLMQAVNDNSAHIAAASDDKKQKRAQ